MGVWAKTRSRCIRATRRRRWQRSVIHYWTLVFFYGML
jgi:hypothetical protein